MSVKTILPSSLVPLVFDGSELQELAQALSHHRGLGRVDEGEPFDVAELEVEHREDDAGKRRPEDFRRRVGVACVEVLLGVEADACSWTEASAPAHALAG